MIHKKTNEYLGHCNFVSGLTDEETKYWGNIGYTVEEKHRGKGYAARASKLLVKFATDNYPTFRQDEVWFMIDPSNIASIKTAEKAGA